MPFLAYFQAVPGHASRTSRGALRRADPHAGRTFAHAVALAAVLSIAGACGRAGEGSSVSAADADAAVRELIAACRPVDPTKTSDFEDRAFHARVATLERLRGAGAQVGRAALEAFQAQPDEILDVRQGLLDVAAHNCPDETAPLLERLITTYDGKGAGLASRAVEILAATSPQRAIALYEPLLREPSAHTTRPSQETLVDGWSIAAQKLGLQEARVLCDVVVDLRQPPEARYAAVRALAPIGGERAQKALRAVLLEGTADGNLRRKAAQTLLKIMPRPQFCALIVEVSEHESDEVFLFFLADLLDKNCPGQ